MAPTIQEVARIAGVSTATVSRTLSNSGVVAQATRAAVMEAVAATGYRANHAARSLRSRRSGSVIALVPNLANPFFSQILAGISSVLTPAGMGLLVADTQAGPDAEARLRHYLTGQIADGLILFDGTLPPEALAIPGRPPVIMACEWLPADLPSVRVENRAGAALAVAHLAEAGHRAIGHLTGPDGNVLTRTRRDGFEAALACRGLARRADWIFEGDFTMDSGAMAAARWLALAERPTALFCASDEMACGFIAAVQRAGLSVPADVSVVGFDNIEVGGHVTPPLTTIRQPRTLIGERAAETLVEMIEAGTLDGPVETIPVELIARASVAAPPGSEG